MDQVHHDWYTYHSILFINMYISFSGIRPLHAFVEVIRGMLNLWASPIDTKQKEQYAERQQVRSISRFLGSAATASSILQVYIFLNYMADHQAHFCEVSRLVSAWTVRRASLGIVIRGMLYEPDRHRIENKKVERQRRSARTVRVCTGISFKWNSRSWW